MARGEIEFDVAKAERLLSQSRELTLRAVAALGLCVAVVLGSGIYGWELSVRIEEAHRQTPEILFSKIRNRILEVKELIKSKIEPLADDVTDGSEAQLARDAARLHEIMLSDGESLRDFLLIQNSTMRDLSSRIPMTEVWLDRYLASLQQFPAKFVVGEAYYTRQARRMNLVSAELTRPELSGPKSIKDL